MEGVFSFSFFPLGKFSCYRLFRYILIVLLQKLQRFFKKEMKQVGKKQLLQGIVVIKGSV
jgi:hypothetical protein